MTPIYNVPSNLYPIKEIEVSQSQYPVVHQDGNYYVDVPYQCQGDVKLVFYDDSHSLISDLNYQLISGNTVRIFIGTASYTKLYVCVYNEENQLPENYLELFCLEATTEDDSLANYRLACGKKKFLTYNTRISDVFSWLQENLGGLFLDADGSLGEYQRNSGPARQNLGVYSKSQIEAKLFRTTDPNNLYYLSDTIPDKAERLTSNKICVGDEFAQKMYPNPIYSYKLIPENGGYCECNRLMDPSLNHMNLYGALPVCTQEGFQIYSSIAGKDATKANTQGVWKQSIPYANKVRLTKLYYNDTSAIDARQNYVPMLSINLHTALPKYDTDESYQFSYWMFDIVTDSWGMPSLTDPLTLSLLAYMNNLPSWAKQTLSSWPTGDSYLGITLLRTARFRTEFKSVAYKDDYTYNDDPGNSRIEKYSYDGRNPVGGTREPRSTFDFTSITYTPTQPNRGYVGDFYPSNSVDTLNIGGPDEGWNVRWNKPSGGTIPALERQEKNTVQAYLYYRTTLGLPRFGIFVVLNSSIHNYGEFNMVPETNIELTSGDSGNKKWGNNEYWITGDILLE